MHPVVLIGLGILLFLFAVVPIGVWVYKGFPHLDKVAISVGLGVILSVIIALFNVILKGTDAFEEDNVIYLAFPILALLLSIIVAIMKGRFIFVD